MMIYREGDSVEFAIPIEDAMGAAEDPLQLGASVDATAHGLDGQDDVAGTVTVAASGAVGYFAPGILAPGRWMIEATATIPGARIERLSNSFRVTVAKAL
ncbi:MAG: hypothetical protein AAF192_01110 [Pseudomonadota bacterium]